MRLAVVHLHTAVFISYRSGPSVLRVKFRLEDTSMYDENNLDQSPGWAMHSVGRNRRQMMYNIHFTDL